MYNIKLRLSTGKDSWVRLAWISDSKSSDNYIQDKQITVQTFNYIDRVCGAVMG